MPESKRFYSKEPFRTFRIGIDGTVNFCCPGWINQYTIGNVFNAPDINAIWNSKSAKTFRQSVMDGSFRFCNSYCPFISTGTLPLYADAPAALRQWLDNPGEDTKIQPTHLQFSYDSSCNLKCPSCRHSNTIDRQQVKRINALMDTIIKPLLQHGHELFFNGSGELFASPHFLQLLDELNPQDYPNLKLSIITNGTLFTEKTWLRYSSLQTMLDKVNVSVDAASTATYKNVRRGGDWRGLLRNLEFIGTLRHSGRINRYSISFVVQLKNYREMADFIRLGREIGVDSIDFSRIQNWGTYSPRKFLLQDICDLRNKNHQNFLKLIKDPLFADSHVFLGNIQTLRQG